MAAFADWPIVKVAEASWAGSALSSLNETAFSLARVIAGSGVSSKLIGLCNSDYWPQTLMNTCSGGQC